MWSTILGGRLCEFDVASLPGIPEVRLAFIGLVRFQSWQCVEICARVGDALLFPQALTRDPLMSLVQSLSRCYRLSTSSVAVRQALKIPSWRSIATIRNLDIDMETVSTTERLKGLRDLMKKNKLDVYSMHCGVLKYVLWLMLFKLYPRKIVINPNILRRVMLVEVSIRRPFATAHTEYHRAYLRLLRLCRYGRGYSRQSCSCHRRSILQSSIKAT